MKQSFYTRSSIGIFAFFLFTAPLVFSLAQRAVKSSGNRVADWLPESFEATQRLHWFEEHFVSDDLLVVSWEGCTLNDPRLPVMAAKLREPVDVGDQSQLTLVRRVVTGPEVVQQLRAEPLELSHREALKRIHGWLLGDDLRTTGVLVLTSKEGWEHRHFLVQHIHDVAATVPGLDPASLHLAGTTIDSVAIDEASHANLQLMMIACYAVGCVLMWIMFRSVALTAMVFVASIYCQEMSLGLVVITGGHMDSVMMMIPSLVYVLAISTGVHLANYYRDAVEQHGPEGAPSLAVRNAIVPCGLASATTALGLGSLGISFLTPVRNFGIYAAAGVVLATVAMFFLLPALLEQFFAGKNPTLLPRRATGDSGWDRMNRWVAAQSGPIFIASLAILAISGWGVYQIRSSARVHDFFSAESTLIRDYDWVEDHIGPMIPLEIIVRMPKQTGESAPSRVDRLRVVGAVHGAIAAHDGIGVVISPLNFAPRIRRRGTTAQAVSRETLLNRELDRNLNAFVEMGFLRDTTDEELWRVSARAYAGRGLDYSVLMTELQERVNPILDRTKSRGWGAVEAVYCGGVPLVQQAQAQMLDDLIHSFVLAFGLITLMMIGLALVGARYDFARSTGVAEKLALVVRSCIAGLVAMIPNVLPCLAVLGGMGLMGIKLEIGSLMTASVALGIAVDDTLHFITWFRRGLAAGQSRAEAVGFAYARCATAMTQTSLICGLGLLTFSFSGFVPIARFAWLMFAMLFAALIADLVVLPAMLVGPLGAVFTTGQPSPTGETTRLSPPYHDRRPSPQLR